MTVESLTEMQVRHWWEHLAAGNSFDVAMAACPALARAAGRPDPTPEEWLAARVLIADAINAAVSERSASRE